jgi:hypothetical protein
MAPALEGDASRWHPGSALLESQGIAVLRDGSRYASLECGAHGGGHGHPDRLHLTLHDRGVHWLADPGAGSYVARDLFWYRSTLAHNAPRVDGVSQALRDATCDFFDAAGAWSWVRGRFGDLSRTLVAGPGYLLDVLELAGEHEHAVELPWHLAGSLEVLSPGSWEPASLAASAAEAGAPGGQEFVSEVSRLRSADSPIRVVARARDMAGGETALALATTAAELFRATAPGPPGSGPRPFLLARESGRSLRVATVLTPGAEPAAVAFADGAIEVKLGGAVHRHTLVADGWQIEAPEGVTRLRGRRSAPRDLPSLSPRIEPPRQTGAAIRSPAPPALDGTLRGFDVRSTLTLDHEDQYRRSEEPYPGSDELSAYAYVNWDDDALYCAVEVTKPEPRFRNASAPPLELDNEPDDIHSDGLQLYLRPEPEGPVYGWLIVPAGGDERLRVRRAAGTAGEPEMVAGDWSLTDTGYVVTLEIRTPGWQERHYGDAIGFDLLVNEIVPGRERRAGQLVWTGGGGWVYLRGDRHDPARLGTLELAGGRAR